MRASQIIKPYLTGQTNQMPERPALLSDGFDWVDWRRLAVAVREGQDVVGGTPTEAMMIAELLMVADRPEGAIAFAEAGMEIKPRLTFYRDVIKRLDRTCAAHTFSPGYAILLGGQTAFRFN